MGSPGPRGVGYIVQLHDQVDVLDETARLSHVYNIEPIFVSTFVPYFHATFDDNVRDRLRCEPSVKSIEYDSSGTPPPASPAR